jgi:uncharacterized protein YbjT (DUF2867 family)
VGSDFGVRTNDHVVAIVGSFRARVFATGPHEPSEHLMTGNKTIAVFGATGKVGSEFVNMALEVGYRLRALVRDRAKFSHGDNPSVEVLEGDATKADDVTRVIEGADLVASFLGRPKKGVHIMFAAYDNIMNAAARQPTPPRCLMISSVGLGGSSWLIKGVLTLIAGRADIEDFEQADARVRADTRVPFALIRPYALTDKPGTGRYKVLPGHTAHFAKPIARADVARFFLDCLDETQWDSSSEVNLGGA